MGVQINGDTGNISATKADYSGNVTIGGTLTYEDVTNVDSVGLITARQGIKIGSGVGVAASISVDGNAEFAGIVTASSFIGSGSGLTGVASTDNIRTNTNATFLQNINVSGIATVGSAVTISESGIEASGIGITCANINGGQIGGRRNIIINGAMRMAQRGTSNTSGGDGYYTVDRMYYYNQGIDNDVTKAQADVASGTTPYTLGFRKSFKLTNGNQTTPGTSDQIQFRYKFEAQDIATSGWNYLSSSSNITLSFWVKSSVAQNFYFYLLTNDGTQQNFPMETGSLSADTWTKIIKTIPGNSNLQFDNNAASGGAIIWDLYRGTTQTGSISLDTWAAFNSSVRTPNQTNTWWINTGATFEITGVQLEVGSQATAFEHRSFGDELALCRRYYYDYLYKETSGGNQYGTTNSNRSLGIVQGWSATEVDHPVKFPTPMRTTPSLIKSTGSNYFQIEGGGLTSTYVDGNWTLQFANVNGCNIYATPDTNVTSGGCYHGVARNTSAQISFDAEL